jgi:tripartite ATP-independent transporter DctM subunit
LPSLFTPQIVIGGKVGGIVTTTEAAAVAVLYSFLLCLIYREIHLSSIFPMLVEVVTTTSVIYLLLGVFNLVSWVLAVEQIPQAITAFFLELTSNWMLVLLIINLVLLLLGTFMEPVPLMVLLGPPLMPVIEHYGIDPVHFGVMFVLNIVIGVVSPPIGTNMFISCAIARCTVGEFTREVIPFLMALVTLLALVTYVPQISLLLPTLLMR